MDPIFNASGYVSRAPRCDAAGGVVLARQLFEAAPRDLTPRSSDALTKVVTAGEKLERGMNERERASESRRRPALSKFGRGWGALEGRLASAAKLSDTPTGARAGELHAMLFDGGLSFLVGDAETQYAESSRRLLFIADEGLTAEVEAIVGDGYLEVVRREHEALGRVIGIGTPLVRTSSSIVHENLVDVQQAILWYCVQVVAESDLASDASVTRLRQALGPIDEWRSGHPYGDDADDAPEPAVGPTPAPVPANEPVVVPVPDRDVA